MLLYKPTSLVDSLFPPKEFIAAMQLFEPKLSDEKMSQILLDLH